jgi:hypothetical protein
VGDGHDGAGVLLQKALEPGDGLRVQMVGRLVEQQHVGLLQKQPAERHAAALAARKLGHLGLARRAAQRVHGDLYLPVEVPGVDGVDLLLQFGLLGDQRVHLVGVGFGERIADFLEAVEQRLGLCHALENVAGDVLGRVELRLLRKVADPDALGRPSLTVDLGVDAGHNPHQRRLAGAVQAEHTDLRPGQEEQPDVLQHLLAAGIGLGDAVHLIDVLVGSHDYSGALGGCRCDWTDREFRARFLAYRPDACNAPATAAPGTGGWAPARPPAARRPACAAAA